MSNRAKALIGLSVGLLLIATLFAIGPAGAHTNDECATVRAAVAAQELVNTAAEQQGGLTSAQRTWIANERGVAAKALLHCQPITVPSTSPSIVSPPPFSPPPSPSASATPSPTSTGTPSAWPGPTNTGVPAGTTLSAYTGSCTITTPDTVIDAKTINCAEVAVRATGVRITRSVINGQIGTPEGSTYSYSLIDSEVNAPVVQESAVGSANITLLRVNVHGGALSVYCWAHCDIRDSWLHGQTLPAGANWHLGALRADDNDDPTLGGAGAPDGGVTDLVAVHNTIACDVAPNSADGGCSGGVTMYGDWGTINHVTLQGNRFVGSAGLSYCLYGGSVPGKAFPNAHDISVTDSVFERGATGNCGAYGAVTDFDTSAPGNVWTGNVWDTGEPVSP
jgi:hypothetical protein